MNIGAIQRAGSLVLDGTLCASGSLYADGAFGYIGSLGQHGALLTLGSLARAGALAELGSLHRYGALCPRLAHTAWCSLLFSLAQPFDKLVKDFIQLRNNYRRSRRGGFLGCLSAWSRSRH
jgi:hypothetical protein